MSIDLPRLPPNYTPQEFQYWWQLVAEAIETNEARQDELLASIQEVQGAQQAVLDALVEVQEATDAANDAATLAQLAAAEAGDMIDQIQAGTLELEAVTIGGQRFINSGGTLTAEP